MKFSSLKMGVQLSLVFGITLVLLSVVGITGFIGVGTLSDRAGEVLETDGKFAEYSAAAYAHVLEQRRHEKNAFLRIDSPEAVAKEFKNWQARTEKLRGELNMLAELATQEGDKAVVASLIQAYATYVTGFNGTYQKILSKAIKTPQEGDLDILGYRDAAREVSSSTELLAVKGNTRLQSIKGQVVDFAQDMQKLILIFSLCALLFVIGSCVPMTLSITRPLRRAVRMIQDLNAGNLDSRLQMVRKDEIGQLAMALDVFADSMKHEILTAFQKLAEGDFTFRAKGLIKTPLEKTNAQLNAFMGNIQVAGEQIAAGSAQVSDASQSLSQGATESASSLEQITASMNEMGSQVKLNAENASQANRLSVQAKGAAEKGNAQMQEMVSAMGEINESGQNISKIIKTIDEIAFQTNLLALNAAVEAARAGQHGKGFAVVAEEVRNLAARSAKAARETAELIEGSVKRTENGTAIAGQTAAALGEIVAGINKVSDLVAEIAAASNEQAQGITQVNQGLGQIDQVTQQNTANAEESAAAAEELSSQAGELQRMLARFTLERREGADSGSAKASRRLPWNSPAKPAAATGQASHPREVIALDDEEF